MIKPKTVISHMRFHLDQHGLPALAGLVLIAGAVALQMLGVNEAYSRAQELRLEQAATRQRLARQPDPAEVNIQRVARFYAGLPAPDGALDAIETIHKAAKTHGVKLANGEYRLTRESGAPLLRYQVSLPARASYLQLRAWIGDVMNAIPTAALEDISLRRDDVGSELLDARVRLTLFLKAD